ncbi:MAG: glycosyltransferase family 2 protein [Candidatus Moranbacteria bacterium]|jgi:GT2 family glycosyltransferase|nr:glycosyltransferase family 2 protein [Candidatus Moranbacteria bacterium]
MKLSFIIVNYRSRQYLKNCIASIFKKVTQIDFEIIVVNNDEEKIKRIEGVSENCLEIFESKKIDKPNKKINIIEVNKNVGFSKANNIGASRGQGEYFCFLNPDTKIISKNIENLIMKFNGDSSIGAIGPKILKNGIIQPWSVGVDMTWNEILRGKVGIAKSEKIWQSNKEQEVDWVSGASLFVKKDVFFGVNGFDENFFLYYEDVDLCKRIRNIGKKIIYCPLFEIEHLEGKSSNKKYEQKVEYFKSQEYYYSKWFSRAVCYFSKIFRFLYLLGYKIK